jgi:hypothetical protein
MVKYVCTFIHIKDKDVTEKEEGRGRDMTIQLIK